MSAKTLEEPMWRMMLRLKMAGCSTRGTKTTGARSLTIAGVLAAGLLMAGAAQGLAQDDAASTSAQRTTQTTVPVSGSAIAPPAKVTYDNRYEIYAGINFMNFMAGQHLATRMNMGGGEFLATYWLQGQDRFLKNLGVALDYRGEAGTTPIDPEANSYPYYIVRPLVYMNMLMAGAQYRGPKNHYAAIDYHAFFGASDGVFNATQKKDQPSSGLDGFYTQTGLYTNRTKPIAALGGSIDFNVSKKVAIRLQPDLILEHFGTETREFVAVSGGVVYRFGKK